jgi:hypothetical protein
MLSKESYHFAYLGYTKQSWKDKYHIYVIRCLNLEDLAYRRYTKHLTLLNAKRDLVFK